MYRDHLEIALTVMFPRFIDVETLLNSFKQPQLPKRQGYVKFAFLTHSSRLRGS